MELTAAAVNLRSVLGRQVSELSSAAAADSHVEEEVDDELRLQWAAIARLPTIRLLRTSLFDQAEAAGKKKVVVDVTKLGANERHLFIEKLISHIESDNLRLLQKLRERIDRVNVKLPTVEVRFENLSVEAECEVVRGKPLPTLWNSLRRLLSISMEVISCKSQERKIRILHNVSGIIKPSRLTLLLGSPGCGKTTLLMALAGKLNHSLEVSGDISYNGYRLDEFVPQKTSAYISQHDEHIPEMTVRETIDFSARCQGIGSRADMMMEVSKIERREGIVPDLDIDTYMKAISVQGQERNLQTDYILKILGLDICANIMVGDALRRGISGGQKRRLTTGEMIVGPMKTLFMDDISTGLDSSTTYQIVSCLQHLVHLTDATAFVSLLQPAPETFNLFDDLVLMSEGKIVYHGPRNSALEFFQHCGFKCPKRKGVADFLQEVLSRKDQAQYWCRSDILYSYISVDQFCEMFRKSYMGQNLQDGLSVAYDRSQSHEVALSFSTYSLSKKEIFKACMSRELLLMKRNSFIYVFKTMQLIVTALITMTVFIRTEMHVDLTHGNYLMGALFYTLIRLLTNGVAELTLTVSRLPVFYKQQSFYLYPAWAYCISSSLLKIPFSLMDSLLWTAMTYYVIGYSPEFSRFFYHFLLLFALHLASTSICRLIASIFKTIVAATTFGSLTLVLMLMFGGFILPRPSLPSWLRWGFWLSPMTYGEIGITLNEFLAPRWQEVSSRGTTLGGDLLTSHGLNFDGYFYWISLAALFGLTVLFDVGFILALTYTNPLGMSRVVISQKKLSTLQRQEAHTNSTRSENSSTIHSSAKTSKERSASTGKMALPFEPLSISFKNVQYYVDTPPEMMARGFKEKKLQLLCDITGAFRPGVLTALMGVSGAGKTTLMDVLSGRKTDGTIEGDIRVGGFPKVQKTFARVSGYCEQFDIHSPHITVEESIMYSAWLRLPVEISSETKTKFVEEVIETIELDDIKDCLVGLPGQSGLSTEQRKRLTIAVELVSNPSIIFMDEPTSGLDARAAAVVMRTVKNVVSTGRTTVCTIHQPSIDVFEAFDELILMKLGGRIIYSGKLGHHSSELIKYFEEIPGVPKITDNYNPATWMLEVTSASTEEKLDLDFCVKYKESDQYKATAELVRQLSEPNPISTDLHFPTRYPQRFHEQLTACLWKQHLSYWRSPDYNLVRLMFMVISSLLFGALFWQKGQDIANEQDLFNVFGSMYIAVIFLGLNYCSSVLPLVATERTVLYRETFAGMYSSSAYSFAQKLVFTPYVGDCRNPIHASPINFVHGNYLPNDRVLLVCTQDPLVLLHDILHILVLCLSWDADDVSEFKSASGFRFSICCLHHIESLLGIPYTWTKNSQVVDMVLLDLPNILVLEGLLDFPVWRCGKRHTHLW
ncbi:pleiotropic drug resistance protein 3-like isoform X2 [Punica granatum]|uniref:Pleiotropic drug resistance protein 3-like isoform X2 n=1 Tax=Punica granatum TaxID=22663 RepID=A0A6P8DP37_PUNGR|nr:pleiotropic drug resistance protein 3-like isoform X2 [Punica granatum]